MTDSNGIAGEVGRKSRLVWYRRTHNEMRTATLPHLPDGKVYGWMTNSGAVYAGDGYPVLASRFSLDNAACDAILILATHSDVPARLAAPAEVDARVEREPTLYMLIVGNAMFHRGETPLNIWRAMYDAALSAQPTGGE